MRRNEIEMTEPEQARFLAEQLVVICATNGTRGWPHLMPLWYTVRDGHLWCWTYAKSQKTRNLERDPRATLQAEAGTRYDQLRGVMIEAETVLHHDLDVVTDFGRELAIRYGGDPDLVPGQAPRRVALEFRTRRVASWDHRKLGGEDGS